MAQNYDPPTFIVARMLQWSALLRLALLSRCSLCGCARLWRLWGSLTCISPTLRACAAARDALPAGDPRRCLRH